MKAEADYRRRLRRESDLRRYITLTVCWRFIGLPKSSTDSNGRLALRVENIKPGPRLRGLDPGVAYVVQVTGFGPMH
jgi:hypothetical protein